MYESFYSEISCHIEWSHWWAKGSSLIDQLERSLDFNLSGLTDVIATEREMYLGRKVLSFVQQKYNSVQNLNVCASWNWVLSKALVAIPRSGEDQKKRLFISNTILTISHILNFVRFSSAFAASDENAHIYGHSYSDLGSVKIVSATAAIISAQCCLYRLALVKLIMTDGVIVTQTLSSIADERDNSLRASKERLSKMVLLSGVVGFVVITMSGGFLFLGMHTMHIMSAESSFETCSWFFWLIVDLMSLALIGGDSALFAAMWILIAINYRLDVLTLTKSVDRANGPDGRYTDRTCNKICTSYIRLVNQAVKVNRMSSFILFSLVLCTTPFFCTALFAVEYGDNLFISVTLFFAIMPVVLFAWSLLAIAANITSLSDALHGRLCSLSARGGFQSSQKIRLLHIVEQTGSEEQLLALCTVDGQKYTSESLLYYLIETCLHYTLLLTFDRSMTGA